MPTTEAIIEVELPSGDAIEVVRRRFGRPEAGARRVALVAGIRGDAPEGIRVAHDVSAVLAACEPRLAGVVDVYPCCNPLAAHRGTRLWPFFDVDLNRLFPGRPDGHPPDRVARALVDDLAGADQVVELRGARPGFREAPQAHVRRGDAVAAERATNCNVAVVWERRPGPAAPGTLAHQFPATIVLEGGVGNMLTDRVGRELTRGVLFLLSTLGVLDEADLPFHWAGLQRPRRVTDEAVLRVRAGRGGLFLPRVAVWDEVEAAAPLGQVVDPATGEPLETVRSPAAGRVLALREQPVVLPGTMIARVVADEPVPEGAAAGRPGEEPGGGGAP